MVIWSIRWQICYIVSVTSRRALQNLVNHSNAIDLENVFIPTRNCFTKTGDLMFFFCHTNGPVYFLRHPRIIAKCEMCRSYKFYKNTFDNNNINIQLNWRVRERANMSHELIIFVTKWYDKKKITIMMIELRESILYVYLFTSIFFLVCLFAFSLSHQCWNADG